MDLKFQSFSEALQAFRKLIQLDLDKIKLLLNDDVVIDGIQNGQAQKFEYTTELCWKAIKEFLKSPITEVVGKSLH